MHNHSNDNKDGGHGHMMWMMIPCILLFGFLFFGGGKLSSSGYFWPILIGAFVVAHIWMMFKGHGGHGDTDMKDEVDDTSAKQPDANLSAAGAAQAGDEHKKGGCCH